MQYDLVLTHLVIIQKDHNAHMTIPFTKWMCMDLCQITVLVIKTQLQENKTLKYTI